MEEYLREMERLRATNPGAVSGLVFQASLGFSYLEAKCLEKRSCMEEIYIYIHIYIYVCIILVYATRLSRISFSSWTRTRSQDSSWTDYILLLGAGRERA